MGTLIGKTFKSKINGKMFRVIELHEEANRNKYSYDYKVVELASGKVVTVDKRVFEEMCLTNLELMEG